MFGEDEEIGHELLSFLFHFVHKNLSTRDPASAVSIFQKIETCFRLSILHASKAVCLLHLHLKYKSAHRGGCILVEMARVEPSSHKVDYFAPLIIY
jgi:hypothetical protein